jgi:hypothetical protein
MQNREMIGTEEEILAKWGFDKDYCFRCKKHNSELSGLLMQCGKCKKAYYCGMKCFNEDLEAHQKVCNTPAYCHRDPDHVLASECPSIVSLSSKKSSTSKKSGKSTKSSSSKKSKKSTKSSKSDKKKKKKDGLGDDGDGKDKSGLAGEDGEKPESQGGGGEGNEGDGEDIIPGADDGEIIPSEIFLGDANASLSNSKSFDANASWISNGYADASWVNRNGSDDDNSDDEASRRKGLGRNTVSFNDGQDARSRNYRLVTPDQNDEKEQLAAEVISLVSVTREEKEFGWEKPAWSSELGMLRKTKNGAKVRSGTDVVRPISKGVDA